MSDFNSPHRRLVAILAADVVGYSRLMEVDEVGTLNALKARRREIVEPLVARHQGRIFKVTGDAVLIEFSSPVNAVKCALDLQTGMARANKAVAEDRHLTLRVGINLGDVLIEGRDLYGDSVNVAARLESIAAPGGIMISGSTYDHVAHKVGIRFEDLGARQLKNIVRPVRVYCAAGTPTVVSGVVGMNGLADTPAMNGASKINGRHGASSPTVAADLLASDRPAVAVLPFVNMSEGPDQDFFCDGITENIITGLSRFRDLFVIASNSTFAYKGCAVNVQEISRDLGARYILEGSVRRGTEALRVNVRLIDGVTGRHLWAERYDRHIDCIFAVQDEVTALIVGTLASTHGGRLHKAWRRHGEDAGRKSGGTKNLPALSYFLRGMELLHSFNKESNRQARDLFEISAQLDPSYAKPLSKIAWCHMVDATFGWAEDAAAALEKGLEFASAAIAIDDDEAWGHHALAGYYMFKRRYGPAIAEYERAVARNPNDADTLTDYAWCLNYAGRPQAALELAHKAMRLNPYCPEWYMAQLGQIYFDARQYEDAVTTLSGLRNLDTVPIHLILAASHAALDQDEAARQAIAHVLELDPEASVTSWSTPERAPYKETRDLAHYRNKLRKAGLRE